MSPPPGAALRRRAGPWRPRSVGLGAGGRRARRRPGPQRPGADPRSADGARNVGAQALQRRRGPSATPPPGSDSGPQIALAARAVAPRAMPATRSPAPIANCTGKEAHSGTPRPRSIAATPFRAEPPRDTAVLIVATPSKITVAAMTIGG